MSVFEKIAYSSVIVSGFVVIVSCILWFTIFIFDRTRKWIIIRDFIFILLCVGTVIMYFSYIVWLLM